MWVHSLVAAAAEAAEDGVEFSVGTLLLYVLGAVALIFVCMLGPISRMYEHRAERRREEAEARAEADGSDAAGG